MLFKSKIYISIFLLNISLIITNCADNVLSPNVKSFTLADTVQINYKEKLSNSDENLSIEFYKLITDSRCPEDVICVWEGDTELKFQLIKNSDSILFSLHSNKSFSNSDSTIFGYNIELVNVEPYPNTQIHYNTSDYSAYIIIKKQ